MISPNPLTCSHERPLEGLRFYFETNVDQMKDLFEYVQESRSIEWWIFEKMNLRRTECGRAQYSRSLSTNPEP